MGRLFRQVIAVFFVLLIAGGGFMLHLNGQQQIGQVDQEVDARREALDQRIAEARQAGKLRGLAYLSLLDQQHRLLVHQRQAEANGMSPAAKRDLLEEIDSVGATVDKLLRK